MTNLDGERAYASDCWMDGGQAMDIRSMLTELCDAFNAHDLDRIMAYFSDDCVLEMPL
jgi:ketosteroid isomerase-like protein